MKKKVVIILGILVLAVALAVTGFAWQRGGGCMGMMGMMMGMGGHGYGGCGGAYADLTEEQQSELDALRQKFFDDTAELREDIQTKMAELHTMLNESDIDAEEAKALQKEVSDLMASIGQYKIDFVIEAKKIVPDGTVPLGCGGGYGRRMMGHGPQRGGFGPGSW